MTKGALYRHYKSKRDIFDCIVEYSKSMFAYWTEDDFASVISSMAQEWIERR